MEFGASNAWWGKLKARSNPHEGIDVVFQVAEEGLATDLSPIEAGRVVHIMDDFIGQTAVIERRSGSKQYWVYGHCQLDPSVKIGEHLSESDTIGRIAVSTRSCPAHLHISLLECRTGSFDDCMWAAVSWKRMPPELSFAPITPFPPRAEMRTLGWGCAGLFAVATALLLRRFTAVHDILLHELAEVPSLPSGAQLSLASVDGEGSEELVWPASAVLCRFLRDQSGWVTRNSHVIDVGSGTGVTGLYAAGLGAARVLLTDQPTRTPLLSTNAARNRHLFSKGSRVDVVNLTWGVDVVHLSSSQLRHVSLILASDLVFPHRALEDLAYTLSSLLRRAKANARILLAHEHRSPARNFRRGLRRWDEHDPPLGTFIGAAARHGLDLTLLSEEPPVGEVKGGFRRWTADISIVEVSFATRRQHENNKG